MSRPSILRPAPLASAVALAVALLATTTFATRSGVLAAQQTGAAAPNRCLLCHAEQREAATVGVHADNGVQCVDCHGGNAAASELPAAHGSGFTGHVDKLATARLCASCHSDPNKMRTYGLNTAELAEFRTSRHGQLLFDQHDANAPTCTDCHGTHVIYPPYDARSKVYPTNIPGTCGHCHADQKLMAKYNLRTDQLTEFTESAHGVALFQKQDFAAPTCVSCHGAHSALPPARSELSTVCGNCHQLVATTFNTGPHGAATRAGQLKGCLGCHTNHGTQRIPDDSIARTCDGCHAEDGRLHQTAVDLQHRMTQATLDLRSANRALDRLTATGQRTSDARFRYRSTLTDYLQIAQVQHGLDLERVEQLEGRVSAGSIELNRIATSSEESRWEHKLILLPVWFLALSAAALAWLALAALRKDAGDGEP